MSINPGPTTPASEPSSAPVMDQAKEQMQDVADRAEAVVGEATTKADAKVREQIDQRSTDAGSQLSASADALRSGGAELRSQGNALAAQAAEHAADQAHRLGAYLERADADQILGDAERVARRNPWAVVVGGVIVGATAARFLKASGGRFETSPAPSSSPTYPTPPPLRTDAR